MKLRVILVLVLVVTAAGPLAAQEPAPAVPDTASAAGSPGMEEAFVPALAVLPPANHTQLGAAAELLESQLYQGLRKKHLSFLEADIIRPILRTHRIRTRGSIGFTDAGVLTEATGVRNLLIASWEIFKTENNPEIAVSLRVLDLESMSLVGAVSVGTTGEDFTGLMGLGTVEEMAELGEIVMDRALDALFPLNEPKDPRLSHRGCFTVALIPFDNYSDTPFAGEIATNILLSRLLSAGYFVVEPGFVKELGLTREVVNRGRVDKGSARALLDRFGACRILTGEVEVFHTASGAARTTVPGFALGLRVINPETGILYLTREFLGSGDEADGLFQRGRVHGLVPLVDGKLGEFLDELIESNRKDILYGRLRQSD